MWKIDTTVFTKEWCQTHAHRSSTALGRLLGVQARTARAYFDALGVPRLMKRGGQFEQNCHTCPHPCDPNGLEDTPCMVPGRMN